MGIITWTKSYSASDNGSIFAGTDIQNIQSDITTVINGGITNANVNASAAIAESKIAFDTSTGHDHDGTDSKTVATQAIHYRKGLTIYGDDDTNVVVRPGVIDIGGTILSTTSASGDLAIATAGNWATGASAVSIWCYVYVYDNSGAIGYALSTEAPDLSDGSGNTTEIPFRYQKYGAVYYRCIGCVFIDAAEDLCWGQAGSEGLYASQFDASTTCVMAGRGTGADQTLNTIWTPKYVKVISSVADTAPVDGDNISIFETTDLMLDANWQGWVGAADLNAMHGVLAANEHEWEAVTTAGSINAITAQVAGTSGGFIIDAMTDDNVFYTIAQTDLC